MKKLPGTDSISSLHIGIDPGCRNLGFAALDYDGKLLKCWSVKTTGGTWEEAFWTAIASVDFGIAGLFSDVFALGEPSSITIENTGWYGRRRGMYALNRLIGALWAYYSTLYHKPDFESLLTQPDERSPIILLARPSDKPKLNKTIRKRAKNEHEADAIALAVWGKARWKKMKNTVNTKQTLPTSCDVVNIEQ